jgi:hypothetical protein
MTAGPQESVGNLVVAIVSIVIGVYLAISILIGRVRGGGGR